MSSLVMWPAYGRAYRTKEEMLADWNAGKDFVAAPRGPYGSIRDLKLIRDMGYDRVRLEQPASRTINQTELAIEIKV